MEAAITHEAIKLELDTMPLFVGSAACGRRVTEMTVQLAGRHHVGATAVMRVHSRHSVRAVRADIAPPFMMHALCVCVDARY